MRKAKVVLAAVAVFGLTFGSALGDDINPPIWRGGPNSSYSESAFPTSANPSSPDVYTNTWGGMVQPVVDVVPADGDVWRVTYEGREGVWPLSGTMTIALPNTTEDHLYKYVWIQITWSPDYPGAARPVVSEIETAGGPYEMHLIGEEAREGTWITTTYAVRLEPNPEHETIFIEVEAFVDQVVVDTICTNEDYPIGAIPTVSEWGLVVLVLLVLAAGTIVLRRQRSLAV